MDEHGMENEHLEHRNSSNTEYLPTKCRVTKPPPPKPATNPLQFIKVAPPPLFQKAKEQVSKVEKIKKERKEVQDEAEDWQANLDNWKSSRRKLQEHIIERVVEVKKLEHEETGRNRRRSKTFNEILEERGKSKYSIPIYMDESNDWSDYGISDSKGSRNVEDIRIGEQNGLGAGDQFSNEKFSTKMNDYCVTGEYSSNVSKQEAKLNNNHYNHDSVLKNGQYTYEGAIEGYRSRIKSKIDDSILGKISDIPKQNVEVDVLVPKGEIVKRKELFDRQLSTEGNHVSGGAAKMLQDFENSISIKQRLKSLERCNDQTVKLVDNINIVPKVKQISQLFDRPCTDNARPYSTEVGHNTNSEYSERREKVNINIVPWAERETVSESPEIYMYVDKHDVKENESQSDDKSSDTFYSGIEDNNYPPSISSTDYMALSSDREDSGIHTADVSCSVSQADDTAEELESNANSHETTNDDYHPSQKYFKHTEDNNNVYNDHILKLTKENVTNRTNIELQEDDISSLYNSSTVSSFSKENIFDSTVKFLDVEKMEAAEGLEAPNHHTVKEYPEEQIADTTETSPEPTRLPEIREEIIKSSDSNKTLVPEVQTISPLGLYRVADSFPVELAGTDYVFDSDFPLLPTKMVEPPKVKPPPPPVVVDDDKPIGANIRRINSTKRIKNEITLKRSSFLGLSEPNDVDNDATEEVPIATPEEEYPRVEEILAKQLYDSKISNYSVVENLKSELIVENGESNINWISTPDENIEKEVNNSSPPDEEEIAKREREIIEMVEKAEKFREPEIVAEELPPLVQVPKPPVPLIRTSMPSAHKSADASYYDKHPDYLDDQDSEVLKVEQELQQLEQEELKRKRDNLLFRQACSRVFAKTKRYSLENIFDSPSSSLDCRKSMPELQCLKMEKELSSRTGEAMRSIRDIDLKYRKSVPNIPGCLQQNYGRFPSNEFQTIERYERKTVPEFQHDVHRSAFEVPSRRSDQYYEPIATAKSSHNRFIQPIEPPLNYAPSSGELQFVTPRNRNGSNGSWLKTRPNIETKSYDQHWLYQEAELRRLQDQKSYSTWQQQPKYATDAALPSLIQRSPILTPHSSSITPVRKLTSVNTDLQPFMEHPHGPSLPAPSVTQPRSVAVEDGPNRILSVSGKKKCSFCGNELGRGAAMIIETLCLFYHMECFKCCVCHVQLGNGLNGTDVRVRNEKLHCHNCYSSDDGIKFSCV